MLTTPQELNTPYGPLGDRKRKHSWDTDEEFQRPRKLMRFDGDSHAIPASKQKSEDNFSTETPYSDESAPGSPARFTDDHQDELVVPSEDYRRREKEELLLQMNDFERRLADEKAHCQKDKTTDLARLEAMLQEVHRLAEELRCDLDHEAHLHQSDKSDTESDTEALLVHIPPILRWKLARAKKSVDPASFAYIQAEEAATMALHRVERSLGVPTTTAPTATDAHSVQSTSSASSTTKPRTASMSRIKKAKLSQLKIPKSTEPIPRPDPRYLNTSSTSKKDVAYYILKREARPMRVKEMAEIGLAEGLLFTKGKTPWETMRRDINADILQKGDESLFVKVDSSLFGLREWFAGDQ